MSNDEAGLRTILIVGGGLSGSLFALRAIEDPENRVILIEKASAVARGVAYGACDDRHRLNVPVQRMEIGLTPSFEQWLATHRPHELTDSDGGPRDAFVTRRSFGDYIEQRTEEAIESGRLRRVRGYAIEAGNNDQPYVLLQDGRVLHGTHVVLATGNLPPRVPRLTEDGVLDSPVFIPDPWQVHAERPVAPTDAVLLIGTGLTTVDVALRMARGGHVGPIIAVSRHGLLPCRHAPGGQWRNAFETETMPPRAAMRRLRRQAREAAEQGVPWQRVIDAMRPSIASLWTSWSHDERRRFLRHCRTIWDVHRHRMARPVAAEIDALIEKGQLQIRAGRIAGLRRVAGGACVSLRPRGEAGLVDIEVGAVINCTGPRSAFDDLNEPLYQKLREGGLMVPDALGLGIQTDGCAVLDRFSIPSGWLFALGPLTRPEWWEITAVPEISAQTLYLAKELARPTQTSLLRDFVDLGSGI